MTAYYEQPLRKLLGVLCPTINWLGAAGTVDVNSVPAEHIEAIKQLERIGVVHKRNNRLYELQRIRLKKLMDSMGMDKLTPIAAVEPPVVLEMPRSVDVKPATAVAEPMALTAVEPRPVAAVEAARPIAVDPSSLN